MNRLKRKVKRLGAKCPPVYELEQIKRGYNGDIRDKDIERIKSIPISGDPREIELREIIWHHSNSVGNQWVISGEDLCNAVNDILMFIEYREAVKKLRAKEDGV